MTTLAAVITAAREDYLLAGSYSRRGRLNGALDASTEVVTMDSTAGISIGTKIAVEYEEMYVWEVTSTTALKVYRADGGTTAATHADDTLVFIDPEYSDGKILRAVNAVVEDLRHEPGLYQVGYLDFTAPHTDEMPIGAHPDASSETGVDHVIEVLMATGDSVEPWQRVRSWDVIQLASDDASPQPVVQVYGASYTSRDIRVVVRQTLGVIGAGTDLEDEVGILNADLLAVGAALRLASGRALRRTSLHAQGDARRANEVAAFSTGNAARDLERRYKQLKNAEMVRLIQQFPTRRRTRG